MNPSQRPEDVEAREQSQRLVIMTRAMRERIRYDREDFFMEGLGARGGVAGPRASSIGRQRSRGPAAEAQAPERSTLRASRNSAWKAASGPSRSPATSAAFSACGAL